MHFANFIPNCNEGSNSLSLLVSGHPRACKYSVHCIVAVRVLITSNYIAAETVSYIGCVMDKENNGLHGCTLHFFISPEI